MKLNESLTKRISNYSSAHSVFTKSPDDIVKRFNEVWFDDLIVKQPELKDDIDSFIYGIKTTPLGNINTRNIFSSIFKDKIEASNIVKQIVTFSYACPLNTSEKITLLNDIIEADPKFLKSYHDYMLENLNNYHIVDDNYISYMALVKKDKNKSNLNHEEVMKIVGNFKPFKMDPIKRITSFFTSYLGKTEESASCIFNVVGKHIETDGTIKKFWEDKIQSFPKEIQDKYSSTKKFEPFTNEQSYFSSYCIDPNWLIDEFDFGTSKANSSTQILYGVILDILEGRSSKETKFHIRNGAKLEIHFQNLEERDNCSKLVNLIFDSLPSELNRYKEVNYDNKRAIIDVLNKSIDSYLFAEELQNTLVSKKEGTLKGMKI